MTPSSEIWITSAGAVTGYGAGLDLLCDGLRRGLGAGRPPRADQASLLPVPLIASAPADLAIPEGFEGDLKVALALAAAGQLPADLGVAGECGVFLGTGLSSVTVDELERDLFPHLDGDVFLRASLAADLTPRAGAPQRHLPARAARALARLLDLTGPVSTSFSACAAGAQAIVSAVQALRRGEIRRAIAGGQDAMAHPLGALSFLLLDTLCSERCRPFDLHRDGFMLGEGAALLLLETPEAAREAGRAPMARLLGVGTSIDAHAITAPHPDGHGAWLTMRRALDDAGIAPDAVEQVNAHGTGTPVGDLAEALAIARLLPAGTPVCSIKGAVGHTIAAAGAVELAATVGAMAAGFSLGTVNCEHPDPACPIRVQREPSVGAPGLVLSNSFGFGGQNASLLVAHPDWQG
jgi:3-oxoacyl-[acyl-carrier-protein] synthase II